MTKRMLIDASHAEETRVVVMDGNRLEDFDVETSTKKQLKGNIYLAKVVRVEPSLQAAFVEFGGNRHGFLAFGEIHPDYYQIPVADRQRLIEMQAEEARQEEEEEDRAAAAEAAREQDQPADIASTGTADDGPGDPPPAAPDPALSFTTDLESEAAADAHEALPAFEDSPGATSGAAQPAVILRNSIAGPVLEDAGEPEAAAPADPATEPVAEFPAASADAASPAPRDEQDSGLFDEHTAPEPAEVEAVVSTTGGEVASAPSDAAPEPAEAEAAEFAADLVGVPAPIDAFPEPAEAEAAALAADLEAVPGPDEAEPHNEPAAEQLPPPEVVGGEGEPGEERDRRVPPRFLRNYKIQEVIKRRQILLVQVVKEERGTKGAALTTYISLAGRFCVLMPNSPRGGGISRKITSVADRRRLKEITAELEIPPGMGLIVRTAGANRPKPEIKRDCEYLMRLWDEIRDLTMRSVAPALIYEEASLIKRSIRDVYSRDLDEIVVDGENGWKTARDFMRMLMPSHAKKVQLWRDSGQSLFARYGVDAQLDAMMSPTVQLRSGGYLVINQTEALVAIDVNSGRSTRERGIEETALRTNLEAADEVARQLRLRDLAGLIVIDFIDMESKKHNAMVERRMKDALKNDRARIQVGHISHFGLLEMSRQRLRPSLAETNFVPCPHCGGSGHVRGTESAAIHVLRQIEEEGAKRRSAEIVVYAATPIALYILNHKRDRLDEIETRHGLAVTFSVDDALVPPLVRIDRVRAAVPSELPPAVTPDLPPIPAEDEAVEEEEADVLDEADASEAASVAAPAEAASGEEASGEEGEEAERRRRRRRRRRRGGRTDGAGSPENEVSVPPGEPVEAEATADPGLDVEGVPERADIDAEGAAGETEPVRARGRGRRGGRRRRPDEGAPLVAPPDAEQPELPVHRGPTPANPFGGQVFDIFDLMDPERAEPMHPTGATGGEPLALPANNSTVPDEASDRLPPTPAKSTDAAAPTEAAPLLAGDDRSDRCSDRYRAVGGSGRDRGRDGRRRPRHHRPAARARSRARARSGRAGCQADPGRGGR